MAQVGNGTNKKANTAIKVIDDQMSKAAAGRYHVCAIALERLFCWGQNNYGQLGDGSRRLIFQQEMMFQ